MKRYDTSLEYYRQQFIDDTCAVLRSGDVAYVNSMAQAEDVSKRLYPRGYNVYVCGSQDGCLLLRAEKEVPHA